MPLFLTKKEVFEWIEKRLRTVDIRKGKAKQGNIAVFVSGKGRNRAIRAKIIKKIEGDLVDLLKQYGFKNIIPTAKTLEEALTI
jgi:ASC-1-like (ASCH) protein